MLINFNDSRQDELDQLLPDEPLNEADDGLSGNGSQSQQLYENRDLKEADNNGGTNLNVSARQSIDVANEKENGTSTKAAMESWAPNERIGAQMLPDSRGKTERQSSFELFELLRVSQLFS